MTKEPEITINGCVLTPAQAATVRLAITRTGADLHEPLAPALMEVVNIMYGSGELESDAAFRKRLLRLTNSLSDVAVIMTAGPFVLDAIGLKYGLARISGTRVDHVSVVEVTAADVGATWCGGEPPAPRPAPLWTTDDSPPAAVLAMVRLCAATWDPEARLLGNVRAGDIVRACDAAIQKLTA